MDRSRTVTRRSVLSGAISATVVAGSGKAASPISGPGIDSAGRSAAPKSVSFNFTGRTARLPSGFNSSGHTGNRTIQNYEGRLTASEAGPRVNQRGLHLEPAATNLLPNPRLRGAVASGNGSFGPAVSVTFTATRGSSLLTIHQTGHGYSAGDRVHCSGTPPAAIGGISIRNRPENAYNIVRTVSVDAYEIAHSRAAAASGTSPAFDMVRAPAPTQTLPDGWAKKGDAASRRFLLRTIAGNAAKSITGSQRELQISGTGTDYLYLSPPIDVTEGDPIAFSMLVYGRGHVFVPDSFQLINQTLELILEWRNSSAAVISETSANLNDHCGSYVYEVGHVQGTAPRTGSVRVALKASGELGSDCALIIHEMMLSKTSWCPLPVLPPEGTSGRASASADHVPSYMHATDIGTVAVAFDMQEVVNAVDGILSIGRIEIRAAGATFPRDLVVSDGTNSVTLARVLNRHHKTQGYNRVAVSWGDFGVRLAHVDGPVVATTATGTTFNPGAASRTVKIGRLADDSGVSALVIKELTLVEQAIGLSELATLATPLRFFPADKPMPLRDFPVGRTSTRRLKVPGIDAAPNPLGAGPAWRVTGPRVALTAAASDVTASDWDFRGFHIWPGGAATNVTFDQCLFDDSASAGFNCIEMFGRSTGWATRHCTFTAVPRPGTRFNTWINSQTEAFLVERCAFFGSQSDIGSGGGMTFRENYVQAGRTALAAHPDTWQFLLGRGPILLERNIIDMRARYNEKAPQNSAIGGGPGLSPVRHSIKFADNMVFGGHNQVAFLQLSNYPKADGEPRWWRSDALPAPGETRILVVRNNFLSMSTANIITNNVGRCLRIELPGAIVLGGTALEKLGLTAGTYANTITGHSIASPHNTPLTTSFKLLGPVPSLGTTVANGGLDVGETITVNRQTITVVAGDALGPAQITQADTIATLAAKISALVPRAVVSVVPYSIDISANSDPLTGASL